jgi:malyl-CoA/(S)-citramalyl-CoA lyase
MADAAKRGLGAVTLDGRMLDAASIRQAEVVMEKMQRIKTGQERAA